MPKDQTNRPDDAKRFVHLHLHTDYSLLQSTVQLKQLAKALEKGGFGACAVTDLGNLYGAVSFTNVMRSSGIKPIVGYEAYLTLGSRHDRNSSVTAGERAFYNIVLLARDLEGYYSLASLASRAFTEGYHHRQRIDLELLKDLSKGLICISGGQNGSIGHFLTSGDVKRARSEAEKLISIFGKDRFYMEIQACAPSEYNDAVADLAAELSVSLVATNDVYYLDRDDARAREVLIAIGENRTIDANEPVKDSERYLRTAEEMWAIFGDKYPEALENTVKIADSIDLKIPMGDDARQLPTFPIPEKYGNITESDYLEIVLDEGFQERLDTEWQPRMNAGELNHTVDEYRERLKLEFETIKRMGFPGYFLIVWDFIRYAREKGIPVGPGRGSAAGSLAAYCMGITDVDPLEHKLLFERFLNPERISMPDIDIDFCIRGRGEVIEHVTRLYGRNSVCQIVTFGTMASRAAIKDVGRALSLSYGDVEKIAKMIPPPVRGRNVSISEALKQVPDLKNAYDGERRFQQLIDLALKVEGCARHTSVHAAGVVISPKPLEQLVPVAISNKEELTSQYPMGDLEKVGMLKMDFLGLTTLTIIQDCLDSLKEIAGVEIDWQSVRTDDPMTMKLFADGKTDAVFQFESSGMQDICRRMRPENLEDLSALNALYRPGPIDGGMIDDFVDRRRGVKDVEYLVEDVKEFLEPTFGVLVYQEQIMQIAQKLAGYSLGDADLMRRAMGKKKIEEMQLHRDKFVSGSVDRKINKKTATEIFELMSKFADYGFNRSHSIAYAVLAFRTAYLKAHFPAYFFAAVLSHEADDSSKVYKYSTELRQMGLELLPPDINESGLGFTPSDKAVRFGLSAIKGIGSSSINAILEARQNGKFSSLFDLVRRVGPTSVNRRALEGLIAAGAFDSVMPESETSFTWRPKLTASINLALQQGARAANDLLSGQGGLFGAEESSSEIDLVDAPPWTTVELSKNEKAAIGFYLSAHPLDIYENVVRKIGVKPVADSFGAQNGSTVKMAGVVTAASVRLSKKGNRFCDFRLEDRSGSVKVLAWSDSYSKNASLLVEDQLLTIEGKVEASEGQDMTIILSDAADLMAVFASNARRMTIRVPNDLKGENAVEDLFLLVANNRGNCAIDLEFETDGVYARLSTDALRVDPTPELRQKLESFGCSVALDTLAAAV